jgi:predicted ABC-type ATPase
VKPILIVIAGPNGSGKTTGTIRARPSKRRNWAANRRKELLTANRNLAFETVFSAPDKVEFLEHAKALDYFVRVFFIGTQDPAINASRVADRVSAGGHSVPLDKIISRYDRSLANLSAAIEIADRSCAHERSMASYARSTAGSPNGLATRSRRSRATPSSRIFATRRVGR